MAKGKWVKGKSPFGGHTIWERREGTDKNYCHAVVSEDRFGEWQLTMGRIRNGMPDMSTLPGRLPSYKTRLEAMAAGDERWSTL